MPTTFRITNELTGVREDVTHYFPEETAAEFGLSTRTVVRRISSGQWHGVRMAVKEIYFVWKIIRHRRKHSQALWLVVKGQPEPPERGQIGSS